MKQVLTSKVAEASAHLAILLSDFKESRFYKALRDDRGDVPG